MTLLQLAILLLVVMSGTAVVFTRNVAAQPMVLSLFGIILAMMFLLFQAADVALSQIVVGAVGLPLMILLAMAKLRRDAEERRQADDKQQQAQK
jgi:energy-converting hydrogenase B subunit D